MISCDNAVRYTLSASALSLASLNICLDASLIRCVAWCSIMTVGVSSMQSLLIVLSQKCLFGSFLQLLHVGSFLLPRNMMVLILSQQIYVPSLQIDNPPNQYLKTDSIQRHLDCSITSTLFRLHLVAMVLCAFRHPHPLRV